MHRALLRLHPEPYRRELGAAIEETLARRGEEARARGRGARLRFFARESLGLLGSAVRERWGLGRRPSKRRGRGTGPHPSRGTGADAAFRELRHASRRLLRNPAFAGAATVTLALGMGATAALFTVVDSVVLSPLPYPDSHRIVYLDHGARGLDRARGLGMTTGFYWQYALRARTVEDVAIYHSFSGSVTGDGDPEAVLVTRATPSFPRALGVAPALGRWLGEEEAVPGGPPVAVLSHGFWTGRYGGDPAALGRSLVLEGAPFEIVGVMPRGFAFPSPDTDLWIPLGLDEGNVRAGGFNFAGVARQAEGATLDDVRAELDALIARLPADFPGDASAAPIVAQARPFSSAVPLKAWILGSTERSLWILLAAVGLVLLVACANVANLFLVRAETRQREVAVRRALGARAGHVAGVWLAEALVLAVAGAAGGLTLAWVGVELLVAFGPPELPRLAEVRLGAPGVALTAAVALLATAALGAVPLLRTSTPAGRALQEGGRGGASGGVRVRARHLLMGAQVALALVLLVASALMARSLERVRSADPGYDPRDALLARVVLPFRSYPSREAAATFHDALLERVRGLPGVRSATATTCPPLSSYCFGDPLTLPGRPRREGEVPPVASFRRVGDAYFSTMGIGVRRGRVFEEADHRTPTRAAVIDERTAELYFPGEDPLGQRIHTDDEDEAPYQVVGVVNHVVTWGVTAPDRPPQVYLPLLSHTEDNTPSLHAMAFVVRSDGPPEALTPGVRGAVAELDPDLPLAEVTTLEAMLARDRAPMAFTMALLLLAAGVALTLGLVGIYGVVSFLVAKRAGEIGVRLALGGRPGAVARMIVWQGARVAVAGLAVGLVAAFGASRVLASLLYGVSPTDAPTYGVVAAGLLAVALVACWLPARRASRMDPVEALRSE